MSETLSDLLIKMGLDPREAIEGLKKVGEAAKATENGFASFSNKASIALAGVGGAALGLGISLAKMASEEATLSAQLNNLYKNAKQTSEVMEYMGKFSYGAGGFFDVDAIKQAGFQMAKFKVSVQENMPIVADLAARQKKGIEESAGWYAKFATGNSRAYMGLTRTMGITVKDLIRFGAVVDANGKLVGGSTENIQRNFEAVKAWSEKYAKGAAEELSKTPAGKFQALKNEIQELKDEIGSGLLPVMVKWTGEVKTAVDQINKLSPEQKNAAADALVWTAAIGLGTAALIRLGTAVGPVIVFMKNIPATIKAVVAGYTALEWAVTSATLSVSAFGVALAAIPVLAGGVIQGTIEYIKVNNQMKDADLQLEATQELYTKKTMGRIDAMKAQGKTSAEIAQGLEGEGYTTKKLISIYEGLQNRYRSVKEAGGAGAAAKLEEIRAQEMQLKEIMGLMGPATAKKKEGGGPAEGDDEYSTAAAKHKKVLEQIALIKQHWEERKSVEETSLQDELAMRKRVLDAAKGDKQAEARALKEYNKTLKDIKKKDVSDTKEAFDEQLKDSRSYISDKVAMNEMDAAGERAAHARVLAQIKKFQTDNAAMLAANPKLRKEVIQAEHQEVLAGLQAEKKEYEKHWTDLEKRMKLYYDGVTKENKHNIQAQIDALDTMDQMIDKAVKKGDIKPQQAKLKKEELDNTRTGLMEQKKDQDIQLEEKKQQIVKDGLSYKLAALEKEREAGKNVDNDIMDTVKARLKAEFDAIDARAKKDLESYGNTKEAKKIIDAEVAQKQKEAIQSESQYLKGIMGEAKNGIKQIDEALEVVKNKYDSSRLGGAASPIQSLAEIAEETHTRMFGGGGGKETLTTGGDAYAGLRPDWMSPGSSFGGLQKDLAEAAKPDTPLKGLAGITGGSSAVASAPKNTFQRRCRKIRSSLRKRLDYHHSLW